MVPHAQGDLRQPAAGANSGFAWTQSQNTCDSALSFFRTWFLISFNDWAVVWCMGFPAFSW
jgi:hypothetical protein